MPGKQLSSCSGRRWLVGCLLAGSCRTGTYREKYIAEPSHASSSSSVQGLKGVLIVRLLAFLAVKRRQFRVEPGKGRMFPRRRTAIKRVPQVINLLRANAFVGCYLGVRLQLVAHRKSKYPIQRTGRPSDKYLEPKTPTRKSVQNRILKYTAAQTKYLIVSHNATAAEPVCRPAGASPGPRGG